MEHYPAIIVVEGTSDEALISSFLDADIVITNGSAVPRETIEYLKKASLTRDIVVLTDPDSPGKKIRDVLDASIPNLQHAYILKEHAIKHHKVGVAESNEKEIRKALSHLVPSHPNKLGNLTMADLSSLGLMGGPSSREKRGLLEKKLYLGHCNAKTLLKRVNALNLSLKDLENCLNG